VPCLKLLPGCSCPTVLPKAVGVPQVTGGYPGKIVTASVGCKRGDPSKR
jgi:hypothetical protein